MNEQQLRQAELRTDDAALLGDLSLIVLDLRSVIELCRRLSAEMAKPKEHQDNQLIEGFWTAALVKYVRCFTTGKRFGLEPSVFAEFEGGVTTHQYFKNMRDKHVAHSVNPFGDVHVAALLPPASSEPQLVQGITVFSHKLLSTDQNGVKTLERLASVAHSYVVSQAKTVQEAVLVWAKAQPIESFAVGRIGMTAPGPEQAGIPRP